MQKRFQRQEQSMQRSRARMLVPLVLTLGLLAAACGSSSSTDKKGGSNGSSSSTAAPAPKLAAATLNGSGATFPQAYYESVIQEFKTAQPAVTVTYGGGGSGKGQTDLQGGLVQWAGSDSTVKPEDVAKFKGPFLYFPTVAAPITVSYNLSGVKLKLTPATLAKIFEGQIKTWDDAAIKADNAGASLPSTAITVAHRSDGSGTTANFTKYLVAAAGPAWTLGTDKVVAWPAGQQAGEGNAGVAQIVKSTTGAIGYVDYSDAKAAGLVFASLKNAAGSFVAPSTESATAALEGATLAADLTYNPLNAPGAKAYPITAPTYILVYTAQPDAAVKAALKGLLGYIYGDGQKLATTVDFAPLPAAILTAAKAQIAKIGA
jgi:phosphate transport system substrate-binding protein